MTCLKTHNLQVRPADWNKVTQQHNKLTVILLFKLLQTTGENIFIDVKTFKHCIPYELSLQSR